MTRVKWKAFLVFAPTLLMVAVASLIAIIGRVVFNLDRIIFGWLW